MTLNSEMDEQADAEEFFDDEDGDESPNRVDIDSAAAPATDPTTDLEDLVRYVATKLVHNPDDIVVESELRSGTVYVSLRVPEE
jgi:hypothetical protein